MSGIDSGPPRAWVPITPHDSNAIVAGCRAIKVGSTAGNIVAKMEGYASDVTLPVAAYEVIVGRFTHVRATGTTATTLHAGV